MEAGPKLLHRLHAGILSMNPSFPATADADAAAAEYLITTDNADGMGKPTHSAAVRA